MLFGVFFGDLLGYGWNKGVFEGLPNRVGIKLVNWMTHNLLKTNHHITNWETGQLCNLTVNPADV